MTNSYVEWIKEVDTHLVMVCGMAHDDLADALWRDYFEDHLSPLEAIESAVDDAWWDTPEMADLLDAHINRIGVKT
jgi:hypothetical protein|tara:strand:- start:1166 stop:1393 length:228 start_codon:yes stop_codon:yes gene_type:complete